MKGPYIITYEGKTPEIHDAAFVAPTAAVTGDVHIGKESSVWFSSVVRGDEHYVRIGERTNLQDCSVIHGTRDKFPAVIGNEVTIGHGAVLHGCTIGDRVLIGTGARVLDGAKVASESIIAAGTVIPEGFEVPPRTLVMGVPARIKRGLRDQDVEWIVSYAANYVQLMKGYLR
jgi:carbonic anhydrase/acetyltransferase-like protein (isoleucine patch superfamily)